jgi:hypothetical protein
MLKPALLLNIAATGLGRDGPPASGKLLVHQEGIVGGPGQEDPKRTNKLQTILDSSFSRDVHMCSASTSTHNVSTLKGNENAMLSPNLLSNKRA